jgi:hypothetical protein
MLIVYTYKKKKEKEKMNRPSPHLARRRPVFGSHCTCGLLGFFTACPLTKERLASVWMNAPAMKVEKIEIH